MENCITMPFRTCHCPWITDLVPGLVGIDHSIIVCCFCNPVVPPVVPKTKKKLIQTIFNFLVKKCTEKQPKKTKNEPEDDEIVPIPPGLFDINPFPTTLLENITRNCDK